LFCVIDETRMASLDDPEKHQKRGAVIVVAINRRTGQGTSVSASTRVA